MQSIWEQNMDSLFLKNKKENKRNEMKYEINTIDSKI